MKKISEVDEKPFTSSSNLTGEKRSRRLSITGICPEARCKKPAPPSPPNFPSAPWIY